MNGISWLLLVLIVLAVVWVVVFKLKNRSSGDCGCGCSSCSSSNKKKNGCSDTKEHIFISRRWASVSKIFQTICSVRQTKILTQLRIFGV